MNSDPLIGGRFGPIRLLYEGLACPTWTTPEPIRIFSEQKERNGPVSAERSSKRSRKLNDSGRQNAGSFRKKMKTPSSSQQQYAEHTWTTLERERSANDREYTRGRNAPSDRSGHRVVSHSLTS